MSVSTTNLVADAVTAATNAIKAAADALNAATDVSVPATNIVEFVANNDVSSNDDSSASDDDSSASNDDSSASNDEKQSITNTQKFAGVAIDVAEESQKKIIEIEDSDDESVTAATALKERINHPKASTKAIKTLLQMPAKRSVNVKAGRDVNLDRSGNEEALLAYTRGEISKRGCEPCQKGCGILSKCVVVSGLFKGSCCSCHYNSEGARCSFRTVLQESSSTRKRDRESDSETSVIVPPLKRSNRRSIRSSLLSSISKDRNPRAISASESTDDADLLTNSERLQRMSNLFTELGKLFGAHARATEKKKENDKENDE